ncbi:hypothetical protein H105_05234 [Trichophyton soudanense CBS 452.61]|uniref:Uncharacterized protein n=1 Tax=Trichophyton soudanense CBS 452.61 TaxID=1215331 RepID=A0A022XRM2_TRISD|nr:hypothetical protein H102_05215 [Trichophyton rubrum CBS 100081]EZF72983.1 hypothetical protein H105_05234 [Trichophyton soudanense CBS 452.61]EZG05325.1 hypothetical protein H106_05056 [Trichophyton rubrum CBS 735.88]
MVAIDPWSEAEKRLKQDVALNKLWEESIRILKEDFTLEENELHSFLICDSNLSADLTRTLENDLVLLCSKALDFQSRAIRYSQKRLAVQFLTDVFKKDAWDEVLRHVGRYDNSIRNTPSSIHDIRVDKKLQEIQNAL